MAVKSQNLDDLVNYVSLHTQNSILFSGIVLPFSILYICVFYIWIMVYGVDAYYEAGIVAICILVFLHVITCLCCFWSVHVQTFLNCRKVRSIYLNNCFYNLLNEFSYLGEISKSWCIS